MHSLENLIIKDLVSVGKAGKYHILYAPFERRVLKPITQAATREEKKRPEKPNGEFKG